ncbi:MAG: YicC family protein [Ruminococcaceae bacterium]|nr:YicC family protein [Oscillospiraceae bacterium]
MTGFGRAKDTIGGMDITVEIKSVNHRYFEFFAKTPRMAQFLEEKLKSFCQERISRGKVEVTVIIDNKNDDAVELEINKVYADAYISALRQMSVVYSIPNDLKLSDLVGVSDLFSVKRQELDEAIITEAVLSVADKALDNFIEMRRVEGERLKADVNSRAVFILEKVAFVEEKSPETVKAYRERIEQRVKELLENVQIDEQRLLTETAIFADRVAVDEETVRLRSHIKQLNDMLNEGGVIGRKLDFIVQEMNREANTIGSKCQNLEIGQTVVDIKSEIEKIREQIQNIE